MSFNLQQHKVCVAVIAVLLSINKATICISSLFYCQTIAFAICVATCETVLQHVQLMRLTIFKCTGVKCLLETNLAPSVKPSVIRRLKVGRYGEKL